MFKNQDIICITMSDWDEAKRCRHHLMSVLAKDNKVLFVERPVNLFLLLKGFSEWKRLSKVFKGIRHKQDNLYLYAPPPIFPGGDWIPWINWVNQKILLLFVKVAVAMLKLKNPILWVFAFPAGELVGRFKEKVSIYFCNDPHYLFAPAGKKREGIIKIEQELIKKVDFVFAVSHTLVEEKKVFNKSTHLIPHGVRIDLFNNAGSIVPTEYEQISSPRIGFVGVLGGKLDYELIDYVAERRGDWEIVLIGPVAEADQIHRQWIEKLKERPNVHFLGNKAPEELPNYIKALDVCLLPYKKSAFSRMFWVPLKFYEYLAAGRPIVSNVILRGAMEYDESVVRTTENRELFIEMIEKSLNNDSDELISKRKIIARNNSWQKRIDKIHSLVALNEK